MLVEAGSSTEEIVAALRGEGFSLVESIAGLIRAGGMPTEDARAAVIESPTWADVRETVESHRWIAPTRRLDAISLERLRDACEADPRILEAWFIGRRMTRADGSEREHDAPAIMLAEAFQGTEPTSKAQVEMMERISAAGAQLDIGGWLFTTHTLRSEVSNLGVLLYRLSDRSV